MLNAAIVGLGRWDKLILEAAQGRSKRIRFVRGVSKEQDTVRDFVARHHLQLSTEFDDVIADPNSTQCSWPRRTL